MKHCRTGLLTLAVMAALVGYVQAQTVPNAPRNLAVTVGDTEARLDWDAPEAGGCATTDYYVIVSRADTGAVVRESQLMTATRWTLDGLAPNTTYRATVMSYGDSCEEENSAQLDFTTNAVSSSSDPARGAGDARYVPDPPRNLAVTPGDTEATVAWTAPSPAAGTCSATHYYVEVWQTNPWKLARESQMMAVTQWTLDGLTASTDYRAIVNAYSDDGTCDGESSQDAVKDFTTNAATASGDPARGAGEAKYAPVSPSGVAITKEGAGDIRVSWTPAPAAANTCAHTEYSLRLEKDGARVGRRVNGITGTHWDYEGAYTAGARYTARVESYSEECDDWSDRARLSTTVP